MRVRTAIRGGAAKTVKLLGVPVDLEDELDHLYGVELAEFVSERTRVATALRKEGRRAEAEQVKELRKPSVSVWTVNQLARRHRKDLDLLLDAGNRLAAAQRALLTGGNRQAFEQAGNDEREALNRLSTRARSILTERGSTTTLERLTSTLRAAAVSDAARPDLARGRLTSDVDPAGFGAFTVDLATVATPPKPKTRPERPDDDQAKQEQAKRQEATKRAAITRSPRRTESRQRARDKSGQEASRCRACRTSRPRRVRTGGTSRRTCSCRPRNGRERGRSGPREARRGPALGARCLQLEELHAGCGLLANGDPCRPSLDCIACGSHRARSASKSRSPPEIERGRPQGPGRTVSRDGG